MSKTLRRIAQFLLLFMSVIATPLYAAVAHVGFLRVILTASHVPGGLPGAYFTDFSTPSVSQGRVVFYAIDSKNHGGIYNNLFNYIQLVADSSTKIPQGRGTFIGFKNLMNKKTVPLIQNRMIVFKGYGGLFQRGLYRFFNNRLSLIVSNHTTMPGFNDTTFEEFLSPCLLNDASVLFIGRYKTYYGIFGVNHYGKLHLLVNANKTAIPNGKGNFLRIQHLVTSPYNSEHAFAFIGEGRITQSQPYGIKRPSKPVKEIPLKDQEIGIYVSDLNKNGKSILKRIADKNTKIPNGLGYFTHFSDLSFDSTHQVAFIGNGILGEEGVYLSTQDGKISMIADLKMIPPQAESQFAKFDELLLSHGIIIFHAETKDKINGIFMYVPQYGLFKILSSHDLVDNKEVADMHISHYGFSGHNLGLLIDFTNGAHAIYVATIQIAAF